VDPVDPLDPVDPVDPVGPVGPGEGLLGALESGAEESRPASEAAALPPAAAGSPERLSVR
jgi:hypothetical protein